MHRQRNFLLFIALAAAVATPALGQVVTSGVGPASGEANGATSIPDFTGVWIHPGFPWFEPPASGPGPVTNKSRWPYIVNQRLGGSPGGSPGLPPNEGGFPRASLIDYDSHPVCANYIRSVQMIIGLSKQAIALKTTLRASLLSV